MNYNLEYERLIDDGYTHEEAETILRGVIEDKRVSDEEDAYIAKREKEERK